MTQCRCNLIIDSCCDLPVGMVGREGVHLIKFPYIMDGQTCLDDLFQTTSAHDFFDGMRAGKCPTTSQVSVAVFQEAFARALRSGVPTVYLSFTSGLSGSYDTAVLIRDQMAQDYPDAELHVVDTKLPSIAEGLLVYEALRQRERGMSARELVNWVEEARNYVRCEFMVDDLEPLRRGGRIPSSVAFAGAKLDVKPLLTVDLEGKLSLVGVARGRKKGIRQLAEYSQANVEDAKGEHFAFVAGSDCPKDVARLKDAVLKLDARMVFLESSIGPVIGSHVGPGMVAIAFWGKDRRCELSVADRIARKVKRGE